MRIGVIASGNLTGIGRVFRETFRRMPSIAPEHEFVLLAPRNGQRETLFAETPRHEFSSPSTPIIGRLFRDSALRRLADRLHLDVLHDMSNGGLPLGELSAATVETVHDTVAYVYPDLVPPSVRRWYRSTVPRVLRQADLIVTVGHTVKTDLVKYLGLPPDKIRVVQNGVDERFRPLEGVASRQLTGLTSPYVLFVGNLTPKRNLHRLVEAFSRLAPRYSEVQLVLAGPYDPHLPYMAELRRIIGRTGLNGRVRLLGHVADDLLPWLYNGAEAFAYVPFYEGFCLPPLEAMACGRPVVVSDNPPLREVVADGAILVDAGSVDRIADGLEAALSNPSLREEIVRKGLARAHQLTWEATARGVLGVYDEVVGLRSA